MDFSFIIINYRTLELTQQCLNSIFSHCLNDNFEIILIDNSSEDGSIEALEKKFGDRVKIIKNSSNLGFAKANNQGAKIAQGKHLFFLNSDTQLKKDILPTLKDVFIQNPNFGILSPQLLTPELQPQDGAHGRFPTLFNLLTRKSRENWKEEVNSSLWQTDWVSGAALVIRKSIFNETNGWDENFFLYFEDVDLCFRANSKIGVCPEISVIHYSGSSLKQSRKRKLYYYKSQNYFFKKQYGLTYSLLMRLIRWPYKLYSCYLRK